jgi:hypothetical protein
MTAKVQKVPGIKTLGVKIKIFSYLCERIYIIA